MIYNTLALILTLGLGTTNIWILLKNSKSFSTGKNFWTTLYKAQNDSYLQGFLPRNGGIANVPIGMVSSLSTEELNFFSIESNGHYLKELDSSFFNDVISFDEEYGWNKKYFFNENPTAF